MFKFGCLRSGLISADLHFSWNSARCQGLVHNEYHCGEEVHGQTMRKPVAGGGGVDSPPPRWLKVMQARRGEGAVWEVGRPSRWLKVHILCLGRYSFLKLQAYRMQEKCSSEAHDCKSVPPGGEHAMKQSTF